MSVSGSTVTVTPLAAGTTVVTVTATDVDGANLSATQTFEATVANRPPVAVGSLADGQDARGPRLGLTWTCRRRSRIRTTTR